MAVLAECPVCHHKQSARNKLCSGKSGCGENLDRAKRSKRVKYWIQYRMPGGKQRKEFVSYSVEEARDADGKRRVQKRENRIFEMLPETNMTFDELGEWYRNLKRVKKLASYKRVVWCIDKFNEVFGPQLVSEIKPVRLEEFQDRCEEEGLALATIDLIFVTVGSAVRKAWDNDMVNDRAVKAFRRVKAKLKKGDNARERTLTLTEYLSLVEVAPAHLKGLLATAFHTGMRQGEMLKLRWSHIDWENGFIRLSGEITKERKAKSIPINHHVRKVLEGLPRAIHHDYVFTYRGNPIKQCITFGFRATCQRAGVPYGLKVENGVRFHDIRTTVKTNMLRAGLNKPLRDIILGHSLQGMDVFYIQLSDNDLREGMEKYTAWLDAQIANVTQSVTQEAKSNWVKK